MPQPVMPWSPHPLCRRPMAGGSLAGPSTEEPAPTTQAAAFLDVSRPFVIKLVRRGELPCRMVGKHRRIPTGALRDYKAKMFREARSAADEMTRMAQDLGLYDLEGPPPNRP